MNKEYHLNESKSFCMLPWTHIHSTPSGVASACCISSSCHTAVGMGNTKEQSLIDCVNSPKMNSLRKDMIAGVLNAECSQCHIHEKTGVSSSRTVMNKVLGEFYDEVINNTNMDGSLKEFKMRYFDIRFSNICNFKCRTCGAGYSSQWEQEDLKNNVSHARIYPKNNKPELVNEILTHVPNIKIAYFAGGEPLITEEHYVILEEMIKTGAAKDIKLRYNTNTSNLRFKDKDLLSMWKHFNKGVAVDASIDHYGDRAEYIRHGTDWSVVENNIKILRSLPFVNFRINTVLSVFNILTIGDFYEYLIRNNLYFPKDQGYTIYPMSSPNYLSCHILPPDYKAIGKKSVNQAIAALLRNKFNLFRLEQLKNVHVWITQNNTWDQEKIKFKEEISRLDTVRNENFKRTFPELAGLIDKE